MKIKPTNSTRKSLWQNDYSYVFDLILHKRYVQLINFYIDIYWTIFLSIHWNWTIVLLPSVNSFCYLSTTPTKMQSRHLINKLSCSTALQEVRDQSGSSDYQLKHIVCWIIMQVKINTPNIAKLKDPDYVLTLHYPQPFK